LVFTANWESTDIHIPHLDRCISERFVLSDAFGAGSHYLSYERHFDTSSTSDLAAPILVLRISRPSSCGE
jgi:hypothetical protein